MRPFIAGAFKALWLVDSLVLVVLGLAAAFLASRRVTASMVIVLLLAAVPLGSAALIYRFIGNFFAGHLNLACGLLIATAALLSKREGLPTNAVAVGLPGR